VNYITINVDKKFLIRGALIVSMLMSHTLLYKHAYNKGMTAAFEYIMSKLGGDKASTSSSIKFSI
jgi:hypothetical protein